VGAGSPSNTMSPGPRPASIPGVILIHPAVGPQHTWPKIGGAVPLSGRGSWVPNLTQSGLGQGIPPSKFHLDPSNLLATIHQCYRQTDRTDRQQSDSIGRTVLQMVAKDGGKTSCTFCNSFCMQALSDFAC